MRRARRGGFRRRRVRITEDRSRSRSSIVRRRPRLASATASRREARGPEEEGAAAAAAPPTQLDASDSSGAELDARLEPEDRRLLQRLRYVLDLLGEPSRANVRRAIHAFLDWALTYRRAHVSRREGDDGSDSRSS